MMRETEKKNQKGNQIEENKKQKGRIGKEEGEVGR